MPKTNVDACVIDRCDHAARYVGMCGAHYARSRRGADLHQPPIRRVGTRELCDVEACGRKHYAHGLCTLHYDRRRRGICFDRPIRHGRIRDRKGYILVRMPGRKNTYKGGYVPEHRLVMEQVLGRPLLSSENVHHLNGQRDDNRPENLELWVITQPSGQRVEDLIAWARELIQRYGGFDDNETEGHRHAG